MQKRQQNRSLCAQVKTGKKITNPTKTNVFLKLCYSRTAYTHVQQAFASCSSQAVCMHLTALSTQWQPCMPPVHRISPCHRQCFIHFPRHHSSTPHVVWFLWKTRDMSRNIKATLASPLVLCIMTEVVTAGGNLGRFITSKLWLLVMRN